MEQEFKKALKSECVCYVYANSEPIALQKQIESRKDSKMTAIYIYGQ